MDPSTVGNDVSPHQKPRIVDFRFTDPVRFLFEHMQGDTNRPASEKISNDEWSKERNSAKASTNNAVSPTVKSPFEDLFPGDNVFTRVTSTLDKTETSGSNQDQTEAKIENVQRSTNNAGTLPIVQDSSPETISNRPDDSAGGQPRRSQEKSNTLPSKASTFSSLVYRASKLEAVANSLARSRISGNATPGKRQDTLSSKTPILKPPPVSRRLASRPLKRTGKPPPPITTSATSRQLQQSTPLQASTTGTKPTTVSNLPGDKLPSPPPPPDSEPDSEATVNTGEDSEPDDPNQALLNLCKKSDWQGVEGLFKQFSKSGLSSSLADPESTELNYDNINRESKKSSFLEYNGIEDNTETTDTAIIENISMLKK